MGIRACGEILAVVLFLSLTVLLAGCKADQSVPLSSSSVSSESNGSGTLLVSDNDNGGTRQMKVGDTMEISLTENTADDLVWKVEEVNSTILYEVSENFDEYNFDDSPFPSSIGKMTFRFVAIHAGQTPLRLACRQADNPSDPPVESLELSVNVE